MEKRDFTFQIGGAKFLLIFFLMIKVKSLLPDFPFNNICSSHWQGIVTRYLCNYYNIKFVITKLCLQGNIQTQASQGSSLNRMCLLYSKLCQSIFSTFLKSTTVRIKEHIFVCFMNSHLGLTSFQKHLSVFFVLKKSPSATYSHIFSIRKPVFL